MAVTRKQFEQQLLDNISYESDPSGAMATKFVAACRALRMLTPAASTQSSGGMIRFASEYDVAQLQQMEDQALRFIDFCNARNPQTLLNNRMVPRQFGLNRMRRDHLPETPPTWAPVHGGGGECE